MTTRAERAAIAAERRAIATDLRAKGRTWAQIGTFLSVTPGRAYQIANPTKRAGNPHRAAPQWAGTIGELVRRRADAVRESAEAVARMVGS